MSEETPQTDRTDALYWAVAKDIRTSCDEIAIDTRGMMKVAARLVGAEGWGLNQALGNEVDEEQIGLIRRRASALVTLLRELPLHLQLATLGMVLLVLAEDGQGASYHAPSEEKPEVAN